MQEVSIIRNRINKNNKYKLSCAIFIISLKDGFCNVIAVINAVPLRIKRNAMSCLTCSKIFEYIGSTYFLYSSKVLICSF